jgi:hypothetical protein
MFPFPFGQCSCKPGAKLLPGKGYSYRLYVNDEILYVNEPGTGVGIGPYLKSNCFMNSSL